MWLEQNYKLRVNVEKLKSSESGKLTSHGEVCRTLQVSHCRCEGWWGLLLLWYLIGHHGGPSIHESVKRASRSIFFNITDSEISFTSQEWLVEQTTTPLIPPPLAQIRENLRSVETNKGGKVQSCFEVQYEVTLLLIRYWTSAAIKGGEEEKKRRGTQRHPHGYDEHPNKQNACTREQITNLTRVSTRAIIQLGTFFRNQLLIFFFKLYLHLCIFFSIFTLPALFFFSNQQKTYTPFHPSFIRWFIPPSSTTTPKNNTACAS